MTMKSGSDETAIRLCDALAAMTRLARLMINVVTDGEMTTKKTEERLNDVYKAIAFVLRTTIRSMRALRDDYYRVAIDLFEHGTRERSLADGVGNGGGDVDATSYHITAYDHQRQWHREGRSEEDEARRRRIRCTVVAIETMRNIAMREAREIARSTTTNLSAEHDDRRRERAAFFINVHKRILNRATWLVSKRTRAEATAASLSSQQAQLVVTRRSRRRNGDVDSSGAVRDHRRSLRCYVCHRTFDKTFHYLQHIRVHYRLNLYLCTGCNEAFVQQNGLNYHVRHCCTFAAVIYGGKEVTMNGVHNGARHMELCESCGVFFENGVALRNHVLREHASSNIDLGINRTQQHNLRLLLNDFEQRREHSL